MCAKHNSILILNIQGCAHGITDGFFPSFSSSAFFRSASLTPKPRYLVGSPSFLEDCKDHGRERMVRGEASVVVLEGPSCMLLGADIDSSEYFNTPDAIRKMNRETVANGLRPSYPSTVSPNSFDGAIPWRTAYLPSWDCLDWRANAVRSDDGIRVISTSMTPRTWIGTTSSSLSSVAMLKGSISRCYHAGHG